MHRIMFVCLGNICRSPMAECVLKQLVAQRGLSESFIIDSAATCGDEIGNPIHHGTRRKLKEMGVPICEHRAVQLRRTDYNRYDLFLCMDGGNLADLRRIFGSDPQHKIKRLLDYSARPRDIADPWYTGNFDVTYDDIFEGCTALLEALSD